MYPALWQILIKASNPTQTDLSCDECLALLEYYASWAGDGEDFEKIKQTTHRHLVTCSHCREQYHQRLNQIEERSRDAHRKSPPK